MFEARTISLFAAAAAGVLLAAAVLPAAPAEAASSPWVNGYNSRARLVAGLVAGDPKRVVAGLEIALEPGWKTYWRMPGESGGVPPHFDWQGSANLAGAEVLYPAPRRLKDASGDAIGYKTAVLFPIEITPQDRGKPVTLELAVEYGICREICVPAEARLRLVVPAAAEAGGEPALAAALASVPRAAGLRRPLDPELKSATARLDGDAPRLVLEVAFPGGKDPDVFVEAPDGIYVPMAKAAGAGPGDVRRYEVDLKDGTDPAELKGKMLTVTMVSAAGASEATWRID